MNIFHMENNRGEPKQAQLAFFFQQKERHFLVISAYMITKVYLDNHFPEILRSMLKATYGLTAFSYYLGEFHKKKKN